MLLEKFYVEKPWGRTDLDSAFNAKDGKKTGEIWYDSQGEVTLPLLVKWLFTSERLSVQVHPDDEQARQLGLVSGKEECWYIVDCDPDATIGMGTKVSLNSEELRQAAISGEIEYLLDWKPVRPGQFYYIPAGTVHAIGAGIRLVEIQQNADITYRLYDYGRPRELHLEDGVAVSKCRPYDDRRSGIALSGDQLVDGPHFRMWRIDSRSDYEKLPQAGKRWIVPVSGTVTTLSFTATVGDCLYIDADEPVSMEEPTSVLVAMI